VTQPVWRVAVTPASRSDSTEMSPLRSARLVAGGLKSYLPVGKTYTGTGGSDSARYCYAAWLRHLASFSDVAPELRPRVAAEMGPGDSLGLGIAALLSGVERYAALDVLAWSCSTATACEAFACSRSKWPGPRRTPTAPA
jgi:hypothetical protein